MMMMMMMKAARLYIYFPYGEISKKRKFTIGKQLFKHTQ